MVEARLVPVDMEDALPLEVEVDAFRLGPAEQVRPGGDGQPGGLDRVRPVVRHGGDEFGEPAQLVPGGAGVHQQWGVVAQHPLDALHQRGAVGPDLGVRCGELAAIGERGFHGRVAMALEQRDRETTFGEGVSGRHAGDATADDCDCLHVVRSSRTSWMGGTWRTMRDARPLCP
ncbi:hypothetical protein D3C72_1566300 [compost metagenome]